MAHASSVFDVIILGASGFTGKFVLRDFLQRLSQAVEQPPSVSGAKGTAQVAWPARFSLALAGRNLGKLRETLAWAVETAPQELHPLPESELRKIELIETDALNRAAMAAVCSRARVLVNCVGPCLLYGETIVAACVEAGVDYVDISGEAEFMESMEVKYSKRALEQGALIVPACGSVSAMSDLGLLFHLRQWPGLQARPSCVDAYARFDAFTCLHAASAETGFISMAKVGSLAHLRRTAPRKPKLKILGSPPAEKGKFVHYKKRIGMWASALPICDRAVVRRTFWDLHGHYPLGLPPQDDSMTTLVEREKLWKPIQPVHYRIFFGARQLKNALCFSIASQLVAKIAPYSWGLKLLMRYPEFFTMGSFTKRGPSLEEVHKMRFEMLFVGRGYKYRMTNKNEATNESKISTVDDVQVDCIEPNVEVVTRITGPESCYLTTAINIVQSALLCVHTRSCLPIGGVLTPASAFGGSRLQECLESCGLTFEKVEANSHNPSVSHTFITPARLSFIAYGFLVFLLAIIILPLGLVNSCFT